MKELVSQLTDQLGIDGAQAESGLGAIFKTAQSSLDANSFSKLTGSFPDIQNFLGDKAGDAAGGGGASGLMGMAMGAIGGAGGSSLGKAAGLAAAFKGAGLDMGMATKFAPIVMKYFNDSGDDGIKKIISELF